jgi:hypothetical protein
MGRGRYLGDAVVAHDSSHHPTTIGVTPNGKAVAELDFNLKKRGDPFEPPREVRTRAKVQLS